MNERIKELAEQAQQYAEYITPQGLEWLPAFKERFAELIVRECASIDFYNLAGFGLYHHDRVHQVIKEHFGVEQ